jgi:hypothetical protein
MRIFAASKRKNALQVLCGASYQRREFRLLD